jgi:mannitol-specific phosphotransferase system IIBC component
VITNVLVCLIIAKKQKTKNKKQKNKKTKKQKKQKNKKISENKNGPHYVIKIGECSCKK